MICVSCYFAITIFTGSGSCFPVGFSVWYCPMKKSNTAKTVAVATLGCKVNQYESAAFQSCFAEQGYALAPVDKPADIYVINTCAVTAKAAAQSRQLIRRVLRTNPEATVVVTGCYAQIAPQQIREIDKVHIAIVGNANKHQVHEAVLADKKLASLVQQNTGGKFFTEIAGLRELNPMPVKRFPGRTRAFLKVQDGCNNFCTYCIVPYARGRSRSLMPEKVLDQARLYGDEGYREIVLTGIHLGQYGLDLTPPRNLLDLLQKLLAATPQIRYRLSSLETNEISPDLLALMKNNDNLMPHLHIPLQSGADTILQKMKRRYSAAQFIERVHLCREMMPEAAIGVDILVGFPGETEEYFNQTFELVSRLPLTYLHVFPYSKRPGTPAAKMGNQVGTKTKEERVALLRELDHIKRKAFYAGSIGSVRSVLVETEKTGDGRGKGFTENYIPVHFKAGPEDANCIVPVKLERLEDRFVVGTLV
jgi:threonylcarbamoyladenosine tRNA methylthiotransferase MtaB